MDQRTDSQGDHGEDHTGPAGGDDTENDAEAQDRECAYQGQTESPPPPASLMLRKTCMAT